MRTCMYIYDIPTTINPSDYPQPSASLRRFAARIQYSCWIVPAAHLSRCDDLTEAIRAIGGRADVVPFEDSETGAAKVRELARRSLEGEAARIRKYIDDSVAKAQDRIAKAQEEVSVDDTNAAIRYQQTALSRALRELTDAQECAVVFDLTGDLGELLQGVRAVIDSRASAFVVERDRARAVAKAAAMGATVTFGSPPIDPGQTNLPGVGG